MQTAELSNARQGDEKALAYIQTESWKSAFHDILSEEDLIQRTDLSKTEAMYARVLNNPMIHVSLETVDGKPHCMAAWSRNRAGLADNVAELICIHSLPDNWRRGYGSMMMEQVLTQMKEEGYQQVILWVFEQNTRARGFYEKHGFLLNPETQNNFGSVEVMYTKKL